MGAGVAVVLVSVSLACVAMALVASRSFFGGAWGGKEPKGNVAPSRGSPFKGPNPGSYNTDAASTTFSH